MYTGIGTAPVPPAGEDPRRRAVGLCVPADPARRLSRVAEPRPWTTTGVPPTASPPNPGPMTPGPVSVRATVRPSWRRCAGAGAPSTRGRSSSPTTCSRSWRTAMRRSPSSSIRNSAPRCSTRTGAVATDRTSAATSVPARSPSGPAHGPPVPAHGPSPPTVPTSPPRRPADESDDAARVAERIATLDLLSDGRVDFGTGEFTTPHRAGRIRRGAFRQTGPVGAGGGRRRPYVRRGALRRVRARTCPLRSAMCCPSHGRNHIRRCGWPAETGTRSASRPPRSSPATKRSGRRFPGLRLGVPASEIGHSENPFIRSLTAFPVEFEAQQPAGAG